MHNTIQLSGKDMMNMVNCNIRQNKKSAWYKKPEHVKTWYNSLSLFAEYYSYYGVVPSSHTIYRNYGLGQWLYRQRKRYRDGELPQVFVNLLSDVTPYWYTGSQEDKYKVTTR